jgi:hypothetical protein
VRAVKYPHGVIHAPSGAVNDWGALARKMVTVTSSRSILVKKRKPHNLAGYEAFVEMQSVEQMVQPNENITVL